MHTQQTLFTQVGLHVMNRASVLAGEDTMETGACLPEFSCLLLTERTLMWL